MAELVEIKENQSLGKYEKLMEIAISSEADVAKFEKLMDLQERWEVKEAKKAFVIALSRFQGKCPVIKKTRQAHNYKYAPLSEIVEQIKDPLAECGLSYRFEQSLNGDEMQVSCIVSHSDGHSERTMMSAIPDATGSKNAIQAIGSSNSYLH